jgi:hypothetical protein
VGRSGCRGSDRGLPAGGAGEAGAAGPRRWEAGSYSDVSYDDGATWHQAATKALGNGVRTVTIPAGGHPGGHATLRASAGDLSGDTVRQTLTGAYGLR